MSNKHVQLQTAVCQYRLEEQEGAKLSQAMMYSVLWGMKAVMHSGLLWLHT